jgi:hypothetical protein
MNLRQHPPGGPLSMFVALMVDDLGSPLPSSQGARHRCFLVLMVDVLGSTTLAPPKKPIIDVCYVDGGHSQIFVSTSQGVHHRCFLTLMVDAPGSPAPAPPRGLTVDIS